MICLNSARGYAIQNNADRSVVVLRYTNLLNGTGGNFPPLRRRRGIEIGRRDIDEKTIGRLSFSCSDAHASGHIHDDANDTTFLGKANVVY